MSLTGAKTAEAETVVAEIKPGAAIKQFPPARNYSSLSVRDLLEAREAYHVHLMHLDNVVATAIGRYRIRTGDWYDKNPPDTTPPVGFERPTGERTLFNSVVRPWSWPCVLVFVREWRDQKAFGASPDQMVPRALYLPDGRVIPTCVVRAVQQAAPASGERRLSFPVGTIGGGNLLVSDVQGAEHLGSVGCLVTDGRATFALTNRHVAGETGTEVFSLLRGKRVRVGVSDERHLTKVLFTKAYPGFAGTFTSANLDAGLVRVDDVSLWTSQIRGLGEPGDPVDLNTDNITLDLIGLPVRAFGGASGELGGSIDGLFYRYKSVGGMEYTADLLIGPRKVAFAPGAEARFTDTLPGDSGTLWCMEDSTAGGTPRLRPIAMQWGGHVLVDGAGGRSRAQSFALATMLSTVCRELDIDILRGTNAGLPNYWGDVGHFTIGAKACEIVKDAKLSQLMLANVDRISFPDGKIRHSSAAGLSKADFCPLADVPDYVWKRGGKSPRGSEGPNHFADMDRPLPDGPDKGKTLLDLCKDPANITPDAWLDYYKRVDDASKGLLPFRVWQLYEAMVAAIGARKIADFVCIAGVLAHYVGDACQPLHISYLHDGDPDRSSGGKALGKGVHSAYEAAMLNSNTVEMLALVNAKLPKQSATATIHGGHEAAAAVVGLMQNTFNTIAPSDIIDAYVNDQHPAAMWAAFKTPTVQLLLDGAICLAKLWESAWAEGNGAGVAGGDIGPIDLDELVALYTNHDFVPSVSLAKIGAILEGVPA